ncbi:MAG: transcriptional regulator [Spirochaetaceae bacterium]|nr:transcriptional regulator [Spirochaetaceae bacterium]MBQ4554254.1 transcriptional regulator [Spirochaetaceae bacterium]MBR4011569.1 transcriptional regulator [Spirochaetaceae bacterium]
MEKILTDEEINIRAQAGFDELISLIAKNTDEAFLNDFFSCLFTPTERKDIANRWLLVEEIEKGTPQRDIAKSFKMSLCKITRGSRELKKENSAFKKMLDFKKSLEN